MTLVWHILKKELQVYFVSPLAYAFLSVFYFLAGLFFYMGLTMTAQANLRVMSINLSVTLLLLLPLLTMRHFADERRSGSFELLMTAPIPIWVLVFSKWLASLLLCLVLLVGSLFFPLVLSYYADPDWGVIATTYMGLFCCCSAFVAGGLFSSSLTEEPVASGLLGVLMLLPFWLIGASSDLAHEPWLKNLMQELGFIYHLEPFLKGMVHTSDVVWFALFSLGFLFLTWRSIESQRWR